MHEVGERKPRRFFGEGACAREAAACGLLGWTFTGHFWAKRDRDPHGNDRTETQTFIRAAGRSTRHHSRENALWAWLNLAIANDVDHPLTESALTGNF